MIYAEITGQNLLIQQVNADSIEDRFFRSYIDLAKSEHRRATLELDSIITRAVPRGHLKRAIAK